MVVWLSTFSIFYLITWIYILTFSNFCLVLETFYYIIKLKRFPKLDTLQGMTCEVYNFEYDFYVFFPEDCWYLKHLLMQGCVKIYHWGPSQFACFFYSKLSFHGYFFKTKYKFQRLRQTVTLISWSNRHTTWCSCGSL